MQSHCLKLEERSWGNKDAEQLLRERREIELREQGCRAVA